MELEEALDKAGSFIEEARGKGYFLSSVFSSTSASSTSFVEWVLHFSGKEKALDCYVKEDGITVEEGQSIGAAAELGVGKVKISAGRALELCARQRNPVTILVSLHGPSPVWTINLISASMNAATFDINAETGEITREETTSILRKD